MSMFNLFAVLSALPLLINQANAMEMEMESEDTRLVRKINAMQKEFDSGESFSEKNQKFAYKLYRGSYLILEHEKKEVSPEVNKKINKTRKGQKHISYEEVEDMKSASRISNTVNFREQIRESYGREAYDLQTNFARISDKNENIEEAANKMFLDNAYLPNAMKIGYRTLETFKRDVQDLYNSIESYKVYSQLQRELTKKTPETEKLEAVERERDKCKKILKNGPEQVSKKLKIVSDTLQTFPPLFIEKILLEAKLEELAKMNAKVEELDKEKTRGVENISLETDEEKLTKLKAKLEGLIKLKAKLEELVKTEAKTEELANEKTRGVENISPETDEGKLSKLTAMLEELSQEIAMLEELSQEMAMLEELMKKNAKLEEKLAKAKELEKKITKD